MNMVCPESSKCGHKCTNHKQIHPRNHECDMWCEFGANGCIEIEVQ